MDHTADHKAWESASDEATVYTGPIGEDGEIPAPFVTIMATVETDIDSLRKIDTHLNYAQAAKHVFYGLAWSIADDVNNGTEIHPDRLARYRYIRSIAQGY